MRIYKFSNVLAIPFGLLLSIFAFLIFSNNYSNLMIWAVIPLAAIILIYLFQPQLDYWWLERNPVSIDTNVLKLIEKTNPRYAKLDKEQKEKFHKRLLLYTEGRAFSAKTMDNDASVPYDIKNMIAQIPVTMTLNMSDFLLKNFDHIVLYKHAFPSPGFKFLHTVETHVEDGVIILSLKHVEAAFFHPNDFYNVAWHAYAEAFIKGNSQIEYPKTKETDWNKLETISGFTKDFILKTIGFKQTDILNVAIVCFFCFHENFKKEWPDMYNGLNKIFN